MEMMGGTLGISHPPERMIILSGHAVHAQWLIFRISHSRPRFTLTRRMARTASNPTQNRTASTRNCGANFAGSGTNDGGDGVATDLAGSSLEAHAERVESAGTEWPYQ